MNKEIDNNNDKQFVKILFNDIMCEHHAPSRIVLTTITNILVSMVYIMINDHHGKTELLHY